LPSFWCLIAVSNLIYAKTKLMVLCPKLFLQVSLSSQVNDSTVSLPTWAKNTEVILDIFLSLKLYP
jgi:hypothetical protein